MREPHHAAKVRQNRLLEREAANLRPVPRADSSSVSKALIKRLYGRAVASKQK